MSEINGPDKNKSTIVDGKAASKSVVVLSLLFLCFPSVYFIYKGVAYPGHDSWVHIRWSTVFAEQLFSGDLYPRWLADVDAGAGSPVMFYYQPLSYYLSSPLLLLFPDKEMFFWRVNFSNTVLVFASFFSARLYLTTVVKQHSSWVPYFGALVYVSGPYFYLADIYVRGAVAESWVFVFVPVLFYGLNMIAAHRIRGVFWITLGVFGIISTHIVSAVFWLPIGCLYLMFGREQKDNLVLAMVSIALGLGLASGYLFTALGYIELANISWMYSLEKVSASFLFGEKTLKLLSSLEFNFRTMIFSFVLFLLLGVVSFSLIVRKVNRMVLFWLLVFVFTLFMLTPLSVWFWINLPIIYKIQFSWRLVGVLSLVFVILYTYTLDRSSNSHSKMVLTSLPILMCILLPILVCVQGALHIHKNSAVDSYDGISERAYQSYLRGDRPSFSSYEYQLVPVETLEKFRYLTNVELGDRFASYEFIEKKPRLVVVKVTAPQGTTIRFKRQSFYGTEIIVNGEILRENFDKRMIVLNVPQGESLVQISLKRMPLERAGYWASLISLMLFILLLYSIRTGSRRLSVLNSIALKAQK